jgi:hypothetical protein
LGFLSATCEAELGRFICVIPFRQVNVADDRPTNDSATAGEEEERQMPKRKKGKMSKCLEKKRREIVTHRQRRGHYERSRN